MEDREKAKDESKGAVRGKSGTVVGSRDPTPGTSTSRQDVLIIGILSLALYALAVSLDLFERIADWSRTHESWEVDELLALSIILVVAAAIFAVRRWREYRQELVQSDQAREALHKAHHELEARVRQRTSELSRMNEQLEKEIVERKKAEELLRVSEARYRQVFENSPTAILTVDARGIINSWNPTCESIVGCPAEEAIGEDSAQFLLTRDQVKRASEILFRVFQGECITGIEWNCESKDRSIRKMTSLVYPLMDDQGTVVECAIASTDVTDLRSIEDALRESQQRLELALKGADLGLWDYHPDTGTLSWDQRWAEMHGYLVDELEPHLSTWGRLVHPEDHSGIMEAFNAHMEGRTPMYESVHRQRRKSGEWIWVQSRGKVVERDERGTPTRITGTTLNVTERKQTEDALKQSEEKYRLVVENAREAIFVVQDRKIRFMNPSGLEQLKYSEEEIFSMCSLDLLVPEDREMVDENYARRVRGEAAPDRYTVRFLDSEGGVILVEMKPVPVTWQEAPATLVFGTDVTERHRADEALMESEQRLQLALEGGDLGLWDWNLETGETFFSQRSIEMLGYSHNETDRHISDWGRLVHPEDIPRITQAFNAHLEGRTPFYESEHRLRHKSGEWMWALAKAKVVERKPDGTPVRVTGINRDTTEQKRAEKALRESEEFNRRLVENAPMGILYLDANGVIEYGNPASNRIFGLPEDQPTPLVGYNAFDLPLVAEQPHVRAYFEAVVQGKPQSDVEFSYRSPFTGQDYTLLAQGTPRFAPDGSVTGAVIMYADLTARKRAEDQLKASLEEKVLLLREMHHRVKNNLQVMSSLLSLQAGYVKDERYIQMFNDAESRIRAMALVHEMLHQSENLKAIHCNEYIQQMVAHLFRYYETRPGTIAYKTSVEDIVIELDTAVPFGLMLCELISNSLKHAFPNGGTGEIEISMRLVDGQKVELVTRDNGVGIPPEQDLDHTQSLGLRLVKVLAEQLAATVELHRQGGTEFRVRFNRVTQNGGT